MILPATTLGWPINIGDEADAVPGVEPAMLLPDEVPLQLGLARKGPLGHRGSFLNQSLVLLSIIDIDMQYTFPSVLYSTLSRERRALGVGRTRVKGTAESDMTHDHMLREFFLGFIKLHILHHAGEEPVYGLALIEELQRHGYELSPGTLYPVLHQLEEAGYLSRLNRVVNGKVRKYYVLSRRGGLALTEAREKIAELVGEVLEAGGARRRSRPRRPRG